MKAISVFPESRQIVMTDEPEPFISQPNEVKLQILQVGICGTDREICSFKYGFPPKGSDHLVIGHEALAQVIEVGPGVKTLKPGDIVVPTVRRPCPHETCKSCRTMRQDFCYTGDFVERGIKERNGYMTEFIVEQEDFLIKVPEGIEDIAVLTEPLTIAEKAIIQINEIQKRLPWSCAYSPNKPKGHCHLALILGAGPIGMLGAFAFKAGGYRTVVYSRETKPNFRADILEMIGTEYVSSEDVSIEELPTVLGNIDVIYEAVGAANFAFDVVKSLGTNGIFALTGVPGRREPINIDGDSIMRNMVLKNQVLFGTVNAGREAFENAIADLQRFKEMWPEAVNALITGRHPIDAHFDLLTQRPQGIKDVLMFAEALSHV